MNVISTNCSVNTEKDSPKICKLFSLCIYGGGGFAKCRRFSKETAGKDFITTTSHRKYILDLFLELTYRDLEISSKRDKMCYANSHYTVKKTQLIALFVAKPAI